MRLILLLFSLLLVAAVFGQNAPAIILDANSEGDVYVVRDGSLVRDISNFETERVAPTSKTWPSRSEVKRSPDNSVFLLAFAGGAGSVDSEDRPRNGIDFGAELHVVLKQDSRFGIDFGGGVGYTSLSASGGKIADAAFHTTFGFTDCKYVSGGARFSYSMRAGVVSPAAYLALSYPLNDRLSLVGRGTFGVDVLPGRAGNYTTGRAQIGVAYHLVR